MITNVGNHDFEQVGSVRWRPSGWDLDTLTVPMKGSAENLDTFIASLTMWDASDVDAHMYLSDWVSDGDPVYPTVDLIYIGKKGGTMPPVKLGESTTLQTISYSAAIVDVASFQIDIQYIAPTVTASAIDSTPVAPSLSDPSTDTREVVYWTVGALSSVDASAIDGTVLDGLLDTAFDDLVLPVFTSEELVPGHYYRNTLAKTLIWTH